MSSEGLGAPSARAGGAEALAVVVTAGVTPYLRRTLRAVARQTVAPEATIVVDVASRHNGLGDGTPVEEIIAASALGAHASVALPRHGVPAHRRAFHLLPAAVPDFCASACPLAPFAVPSCPVSTSPCVVRLRAGRFPWNP